MTSLEAAARIANAAMDQEMMERKHYMKFVEVAEHIISQAIDDRGMGGTYVINKYSLRCTCDAEPEQYDVFYANEKVGYLRMRHGQFTVDVPDVGGLRVYELSVAGDSCFESNERLSHLTAAIAAINAHLITAKAINEANKALAPVEEEKENDET